MPISSPPDPTTPALVAGTATPPACREAGTPHAYVTPEERARWYAAKRGFGDYDSKMICMLIEALGAADARLAELLAALLNAEGAILMVLQHHELEPGSNLYKALTSDLEYTRAAIVSARDFLGERPAPRDRGA